MLQDEAVCQTWRLVAVIGACFEGILAAARAEKPDVEKWAVDAWLKVRTPEPTTASAGAAVTCLGVGCGSARLQAVAAGLGQLPAATCAAFSSAHVSTSVRGVLHCLAEHGKAWVGHGGEASCEAS